MYGAFRQGARSEIESVSNRIYQQHENPLSVMQSLGLRPNSISSSELTQKLRTGQKAIVNYVEKETEHMFNDGHIEEEVNSHSVLALGSVDVSGVGTMLVVLDSGVGRTRLLPLNRLKITDVYLVSSEARSLW